MNFLLVILFTCISNFSILPKNTVDAPHWYRPTVYNDYIDFFDDDGHLVGRLAFDATSSKAYFSSPTLTLRFQTKGFFDGEIKIADKYNRNKLGIIRKTNKKRNRLVMFDGREYSINLKEMSISEDGVMLLQFKEKSKNEFVVHSYVHNKQEMLELNAILMYGRIAWMFGGAG